METIYLDNAATTRMRPEVLEAMLPYFREEYGNPSSIYDLGQTASDAVVQARQKIADTLNVSANEIYFTASGTESDNWAVKGAARAAAAKGKGKHIVTSAVEHHAVLHSCQTLEKEGFEVTYLPVNRDGIVNVADFEGPSVPIPCWRRSCSPTTKSARCNPSDNWRRSRMNMASCSIPTPCKPMDTKPSIFPN